MSFPRVWDNAACLVQTCDSVEMIYLPAFQFDFTLDDSLSDESPCEIRIPCPVDDLFKLCKDFIEFESVADVALPLLHESPGLLVYVLARFRTERGAPPKDLNALIEWMNHRFFCEAIEYYSFEAAQRMTIVQQNLLVKWLHKKSKRRTAHYLASVTELSKSSARQLVDSIWCDFISASHDVNSVQGDQAELGGYVTDQTQPLPIRHLWNVCGKLQRLSSDFDSGLLRNKLLAMKQLAYGASHEINNPLANIATRAQSLLTEETNASKRQRLSVIYSQAIRAHEMISDMMLFAQPPDLSFESVQIRTLIDNVIGELASEFENAQIVIGIREYPEAERCEIDATQISVAIKALLINSLEAIGLGGEIRIQIWKRDNDTLGISVADNGCGIESDALDQIFDPFYSGREAGRGLGFGLSKVWRIVELHGGEIKLQSDENWATRFVISLPQKSGMSDSSSSSRIDNSRAA